MSAQRRSRSSTESYRFSVTRTLSDYPLLIGEILRRDERRSRQEAKRNSFFYRLGRTLGVRLRCSLGSPFNGHSREGSMPQEGGEPLQPVFGMRALKVNEIKRCSHRAMEPD